MTASITHRDPGPGTRTVRRVTARLLAVAIVLTSPAWLHGAVTQAPAMAMWWNVLVIGLVMIAALYVMVVGVRGTAMRVPAAAMGVAVAVGVLTWPAGVVDAAAAATRLPWLWLILPPALAAVAILESVVLSVGYGVAVAAVFVSYRSLDLGGGGPPGIVVMEGILLVVIGVGLALLVRTAAAAARRVDEDAARATAARAAAASLAAGAASRADVDAVIHDRVLSALTVVSGSPHSPRVADLARDALDALWAPADPVSGDPVGLDELRARLAAAIGPLAPGLEVTGGDAAGGSAVARAAPGVARADPPVSPPVAVPVAVGVAVPETVARAVVEAATEAVRNSVRHGREDGSPPTVTIAVSAVTTPSGGPPAVVVVVRDDGRGFVPDAVPPGRLGLEFSIRGRIRAVDGDAEVRSAPGAGTSVVLRWPADDRVRGVS